MPARIDSPLVFELEDVRYTYSRRQLALDGISLHVRQGEHVALLGANGCGKSTLLKMLDGLLRPTSGRLRLLGDDIATLESDASEEHGFHRQVGLVFQDPDVQLFSPTVGDDVAFGPLQLGLPLPEVRRRVESALNEMEIPQLRDRAPFELSGGEKKRAAIASVLSLAPSVILFDEPTASLDPRTKWVLVNLIQKLGESGRTTIVATHDLEIVPLIAERVVVIGEERKVLADGTPAEILEDEALLIRANLIHEHLHRHAALVHSHAHDAGHHSPDKDGATVSGT
ncbi:MAG: energy-coupling factor ABC transporter ATP-binding protein [Dehalococcoidia bacterium]|nr:energy-coupling factor ABC transporter ATP-binding protein [Dehalococcoidia bacterium]